MDYLTVQKAFDKYIDMDPDYVVLYVKPKTSYKQRFGYNVAVHTIAVIKAGKAIKTERLTGVWLS
jgi:hypothetical protein